MAHRAKPHLSTHPRSTMRAKLYSVLSLLLIGLSIYFFFRTLTFLTSKDYVGGLVTALIGFIVIRFGVELSRVAIVADVEEQSSQSNH